VDRPFATEEKRAHGERIGRHLALDVSSGSATSGSATSGSATSGSATSGSDRVDVNEASQLGGSHASTGSCSLESFLQGLAQAAHEFSLQLDLERLLAEIARQGHSLIRSERAIVYSNFDDRLRPVVDFPSSPKLTDAVPEGVALCVRYLKSKVVNRSLCVPIVGTQSRILGAIELRRDGLSADFSSQDIRLGECLVEVASSAVDRARLFFRIEEWKRSTETLLSFNATVNQRLEPEAMLHELVTNVTRFLDADAGASGLTLRSDSDAVFQCEGFYFAGRWHEFHRRWKSGEGLPGVVLRTEFPCLVDDYHADSRSDRDLAARFDLCSTVCVPIKNSREQVLGFFQWHRRRGRPEFTWQDAAFLESLGNTAAVAIENSRLVKSLELKNTQIKTLSLHHVQRLEEERKHIARELHDETGQVLIGLKLRLKILSGLLTGDQQDAKDELSELGTQLSSATAKLKDFAKRLRPPTLDELGFESAIRQLVSEFRRHTTLKIDVDFGSWPKLPSSSETALYRIVQECLTNVVKHAQATRVDISMVTEQHRSVLRIADDGIGFDFDSLAGGLGLIGMRERVRMLDGRINVQSRLGHGTIVAVTLKTEEAE
jgi:signal transduction histidine kinase